MLIQLFFILFILIVSLGAMIMPEMRTYALQIVALLAIFAIIVRRFEARQQAEEQTVARKDEETLLFLTTDILPSLEKLQEKHPHAALLETVQRIRTFVEHHA